MPKDFSLEEYMFAVGQHPPMPEMLEYLSEHHRDWEDESDLFRPSEGGVCEKCSVRALNLNPMSELKSSENSGFDGGEIHYSKYVAEQLVVGSEPIVLTPNLHREFVYQSWIEAEHLNHIPLDKRNEPGIAAIEAFPELIDGAGNLTLSFRAIDGSHRAALAYKEGLPFSARILLPHQILKSTFAIGNKKNPFFVAGYTRDMEKLLAMMARGEVGPNVPLA